jgi:hypothetical protein
MTGVACKPSCMANRGVQARSKRRSAAYARQREQYDAAAVRRAEERARDAAARRAADAQSAATKRWGTRADALERLGYLGRSLDRLRREQDALLLERDQLIIHLREVGESWNSLASRTGLSRQALSKRTTGPNGH